MTTKQKTLMEQENWDYLIILDACRYDYFEKSVHSFFKGTLTKAVSSGSCTLEWCTRTFDTGSYGEVTYVSSNPFINSRMELRGFRASSVFHGIEIK